MQIIVTPTRNSLRNAELHWWMLTDTLFLMHVTVGQLLKVLLRVKRIEKSTENEILAQCAPGSVFQNVYLSS